MLRTRSSVGQASYLPINFEHKQAAELRSAGQPGLLSLREQFLYENEPTWDCLNSRKPVIVILLSGFLSTTDSKEWRGNQVPPRYRKSCIRFPAFLSTGLPSVSPSTTHGLSIWKRSKNPHFCADKSESPSGADHFPKGPPIG